MRALLTRTLIALVALVVLGIGATACSAPGSGGDLDDSSEPLDVDKGRQLFQTSCRSCHALVDAKAAGVFGPDLDLLQPDAERVREQVEEGGGGMPSEILTGEDADLVARYVAQVAGQGAEGGDGAQDPTSRGASRPGAEG